jgi:hypothetical protein
VVVDINL